MENSTTPANMFTLEIDNYFKTLQILKVQVLEKLADGDGYTQ
jgi:hypothetical protein